MNKLINTLLILTLGISVKAQKSDFKINNKIDSIIKKYNIPSMVVAVVKPDTCIYGRSGILRLGSDDRTNLKCKYHLGSNTKAITAFIAMHLVEQGKIKLNSRLLNVVPQLKRTTRKEYRNITLADLLSHSAQLQAYTSDKEFTKLPKMKGTASEQRLQFAKFVLTEDTASYKTYSNAGFGIASLMLEKASGKSFESLVQKTFSDLNLDYFIGFPNKQNHLYPWGHWKEKGKLIALSPQHKYGIESFILAAGDISMDIVDYSKLIQLHLNGISGKSNYLKHSSYKILFDYEKTYGLGWGNGISKKGVKIYAHVGSAGTFLCKTVLIPEWKTAVIVIINSAEDEHMKAEKEIRKILFDTYAEK